MDRPRRSTRNSMYNNVSSSSNSTTPTAAAGTTNTPSTTNPYKKPTYLANRPTPPPPSQETPRGGRGRGRGRPASSGRNGAAATVSSSSNGRGRSSNARPECVATRVESRRSTGGSSASNNNKKKKRGAYNSQDYHYGSDFSDQNDSETEPLEDPESGSESTSGLDDKDDSDSDFSIHSSSTPKVGPIRLPSPPVPIWMDTDTIIEELDLPKSSDDLLLNRDLVMKAVAIYEPLRRFHQLVRLSPFRFEDFCAALAHEETSSLLTEIHIQLLKTILREEEVNSTMFGPAEVKDSIQAVLYFIDNLTWPECLRAYIDSDPNWSQVHEVISSVEYPFCGAEARIKILSWMVDQFLATSLVRDVLISENIRHDDYCRACNKVGEVVMCDTCPAVYHLYCISPPYKNDENPPDDWQCPVCVKNNMRGIGDCASELEKAGLLIRHEKLGNDRHGRKYWFLVRRVLVESEDGSSVWYYSTPLQVEELLYRLDEEGYEAELVENIRNCKDEIVRQMEVTEKITEEMKSVLHRKTYIEAENLFLKKIHEDREQAHIQEIENQAKEAERALHAEREEEEKKVLVEEEVKQKDELEKKRIREERLLRRNQNKFVDYNPAEWNEDGTPKIPPISDAANHVFGSLGGFNDEDDGICNSKGIEVTDCKVDTTSKEGMTPSEIASAETQVINCSEEIEIGSSSSSPPTLEAETASSKPIKSEGEESQLEIKAEKMDVDKEIVKKENYDDLFTPVKSNAQTTTTTTTTIPKEEIINELPVLPNANRRKSKALLLDWDTEERMTRLKATGLYKLGQDGTFRNYTNVYNADTLALSKFQHGEESNKKRHMSHKFSLTSASEVKWNSFSNMAGLRCNMAACLRATLTHLEGAVPSTLMHVNWSALRKAWVSAVSACTGPKDFSKAMIALAACLRPSIYNPIWTESLAHHKLLRTSAFEREERKKAEKRDKKDRDDEEDRLRLLPQFVKYSIPAKHQVYKQKGEEYRIHGRWGWIWMSNLRRCKPQDSRKTGLLSGPFKHVIQVKNDTGKVKTILIDPSVFDKLMAKRSLSQKSTPTSSVVNTGATNSPASSIITASDPLPIKSAVVSEEDKVTTTEPVKMEIVADPEVAVSSSSDEKPVVEEIPVVEDKEVCKQEVEVVGGGETEVKMEEGEEPVVPAAVIEKSEEQTEIVESLVKEEDVSAPSVDVPSSSSPPAIPTPMDVDVAPVEPKLESESEPCDKVDTISDEPAEGNVTPKSEPVEESGVEEVIPAAVEEKVALFKSEGEIKGEKEARPSTPASLSIPPTTSAPSTPSGGVEAAAGRKFRTELINVSLGIVSANRILYPKIAHKCHILDNLLSRRMQLQKLEEEELLESYGKEKLDQVQKILDAGGLISLEDEPPKIKEEDESTSQEEVLEDSFPLAGIYRFKCYSHMCQSASAAFAQQKETKIREYEYKCYSPMCRLKFFVQDSNRRKEERIKLAERAKLAQMVDEVKGKKMFTQVESCCKILLKQLPNESQKRRNQVKYPLTSTFKSGSAKDPSIFILPHHDLKKLSRTAGRTFTPSGFAPAPKTGSWAWPYPCGRPVFRTGWQFKAVHANTLAAAALQLRILWASVKWDDIQMKAPNYDGKNQITTDMEIITSEILNHRVVGRFLERVQYLRKKTVEPIDAPKAIREVTPSRSGLRKRKLAESLLGVDPVITEDWVDEDRVELWEIKLYHEKLERKNDPKPGTPLGSTRTKSGVTLKQPEKYDPSPIEKEKSDKEKADKSMSPAKMAEIMREKLETEEKMQRAVHLSKRDNHPKNNNAVNKTPTPTASQQLQQQQAAAGLPANPRSYGGAGPTTIQKKVTVVTKAIPVGGADSASATTASAAVAILNRKNPGGIHTVAIPKVLQPGQVIQPGQVQQKITIFRSPDGKIQVNGLIPGQTVVQTSDGKIQLGTPKAGGGPMQTHIIHPQTQGQTILIQSQGSGQLQPQPSGGMLQIQAANPTPNQPLINISSPTMRTVLASGQGVGTSGGTVKLIQSPHVVTVASSASTNNPGQLVHTYSAGKNVRKVNPKLPSTPTAIAPAASPVVVSTGGNSQQVTGTLNAQGQIVLTRGGQVIQGLNQQGQIVIASSAQARPQGTIVVSSSGNVVGISPKTPISVTTAANTPPATTAATTTLQVATSQTSSPVTSQQIQTAAGTIARVTHQPGGKIMIQDGNKTIIVSGGSNLTAQQLQQILAMQLKKPAGAAGGNQVGNKQQIIQQVVTAQGGGGQQIQIPQQTMQILQQQAGAGGQGQTVQVIGGQNIQTIGTSGQGGQIVLQSGHQLATIGGQNVIVKKIMKGGSPVKSAGGSSVTIAAAPGTPMPTAAQIQQLLASNKNLIRVDPKTGVMNISSATFQQLQQQQQQQSPMISGITSSVTQGSTTVTRTPGLPISIVSPSKNPKIVPTLFPGGQGTPTSSQSIVKTIPSVATPLVTPTARYTIIQQGNKKGATPIVAAAKQQQQLSEAASAIVANPAPTTPTRAAAVLPPPPSPVPGKIAAQFMETPEGPKVIVSGFKPGDLTPSQLANLNSQIMKQLQEHPALREKFLAMGNAVNEIKIVLQQHPNPPPPPGILPAGSTAPTEAGASSPTKMVKVGPSSPIKSLPVKAASPARLASSPARLTSPVRLASPVKGAGSPIKAIATGSPGKIQSPIASPVKGLASPVTHGVASLAAKSPPNSANIDAAIAHVASDIDSPVILPAAKSPKKGGGISVPSLLPTSPAKEDILKNILQKVDAENTQFEPAVAVVKSPSKRKTSPGKKNPAPIDTLTPVETCTFVPQPVEQDVVISEDGVANEVEISENNHGEAEEDVPRFVLNQDLIGHASGQKQATESTPTASSMTFFAGEPQSNNNNNNASPEMSPTNNSANKPKSGSSRRKSPVKTKTIMHNSESPMIASPPKKRISMSPMATQKQIVAMNKHKELLRKDMSKKRVLLERDLLMDIRKEISEEDKGLLSDEEQQNHQQRGQQKKRKSSGSRSSGGGKRKKHNSSGSPPSKKPKTGNKLHCICKTVYDKNRFYICCDICSGWYHGDCVGIGEEEGRVVPEFVCVQCRPASANEGDATSKTMCVCRQPYVETQFCIACEKCDEWFHGRCVGILPTEGDGIPAYYCPACQPSMKINAINAKTLRDEHYIEISKTLRQIQSHKSAYPFMNPVNAGDVPNYYKVIKEPMDLKTIALRVEEKMYTKLLDFVADLAKIIDNYRFFNPPESQIYKAGHLLEKFCSQKMGHLRSVLDKK